MVKEAVNSGIKYPRRRFIRGLLRTSGYVALDLLTDLHVFGQENLPEKGPLLVVVNHFSYIDPAVVICITPWPIEVLGGFQTPSAPFWGKWLLRLWGYFPVFRGTGSRVALQSAESALAQGGVVGIAPEGGAWSDVLRPPRPGAAYLSVRTGSHILPIGIDGAKDVFPKLRKGQRAQVTARIGKPFGPFIAKGIGRERRKQLDAIGDEIMQHIAPLIPPDRRGHYSKDPTIRAAARGSEIYPWADTQEG